MGKTDILVSHSRSFFRLMQIMVWRKARVFTQKRVAEHFLIIFLFFSCMATHLNRFVKYYFLSGPPGCEHFCRPGYHIPKLKVQLEVPVKFNQTTANDGRHRNPGAMVPQRA